MKAFSSRVAAFLLVAIVFIGPFPLGAEKDWAWSPLALLVGVGLVFAAWGRPRHAVLHTLPLSIVVATVSMSLVLIWVAAQSLGWVGESAFDSFLRSAEAALGSGLPSRSVIDKEASITGLMLLTAYAGVFGLACLLGGDRQRANRVHIAVVVSAVLITLYGWMSELFVRSCVAIFVIKRPLESGDPCSFSGTFVNSSNYTDYAALACLICIASIQEQLLQIHSPRASARVQWRARLMVLTGKQSLFYVAALVFLLASAAYSASKAGLASLALAAIVMTTLTTAFQKGRTGSVMTASVSVGVIITLVGALGGQAIVGRFLTYFEQGDADRNQLFSIAAHAIAANPRSGWGLGSFPSLYSVFQPPTLESFFENVHNTYLESAVELGIPVSMVFFIAILAPCLRCLNGLRERHRDRQFAAVAIGAALLLGLHSLVDFGSQIVAIAVTFAALLGVGWAQSWSSRLEPRARNRNREGIPKELEV